MVSRYIPESTMRNEDVDRAMGGSLSWANSPVLEEDDTEFSTTFCDHPEESSLKVMRLCEQACIENDSKLLSCYWHEEHCFGGDLNRLAQLSDSCQIFSIRQKNSYSRLYVTRDQFEELLYAYSIFSLIWDFMLPFSFKTHESDIGHAPIRFRQLGPLSLPGGKPGSFGKLSL